MRNTSYLKGKQSKTGKIEIFWVENFQYVEYDEDGSEITVAFTDNTRLWIEITEFSDNSIPEVVLFGKNDELIEIIQEGYEMS